MLRYVETLAILIGFALFVAGLMGDGKAGPILGMILGVVLIDSHAWLPCVLARLAKLQRWVNDVLDDFGI